MAQTPPTSPRGSATEVFWAFLKLGMTSFGGPVAHLGYFRAEIVERRRWIDESGFAGYVALAQLLPGPASSQVGLALGLHRAGWWGGLAAFAGFTLPSALIMLIAAYAYERGQGFEGGWLHGLKLVAVVVVAEAVRQMARQLCPDRATKALAVLGALLALVLGGFLGQLGAIAVGALLGGLLLKQQQRTDASPLAAGCFQPSSATSRWLLVCAVGLLLVAVLASFLPLPRLLEVAGGFYRAGSLVFGGGHVVLPLLEEVVVRPGFLDHNAFLAGYGAAQALPGPLFSLSAYLGFLAGEGSLLAALVALGCIFLPGFLLVCAFSSRWQSLLAKPGLAGVFAGVNAAVVGLLLAALYTPVATSALTSPGAGALALLGWALLALARAPVLAVVLLLPVLGQAFL
ncbi:chromate efflux transporter [Limibacillus halophilus]